MKSATRAKAGSSVSQDYTTPSPFPSLHHSGGESPLRRKSISVVDAPDMPIAHRLLWPSSSNDHFSRSDCLCHQVDGEYGRSGEADFLELTTTSRRSSANSRRFRENEEVAEKTARDVKNLKKQNQFSSSMRYSSKSRLVLSSPPLSPTVAKARTTHFASAANRSKKQYTPGRISVDEDTLRHRREKMSESSIDFPSSGSERNGSTNRSNTSTRQLTLYPPRRTCVCQKLSSNSFDGQTVASAVLQKPGFAPLNRAGSYRSAGTDQQINHSSLLRRSTSPAWSRDSSEERIPLQSISSLRPKWGRDSNSDKGGKVGELISMGLGLFRKKHSKSTSQGLYVGMAAAGSRESHHEFRICYNRLLQWRYVNARAEAVGHKRAVHANGELLGSYGSLRNLQMKVAMKRMELYRKEQEMKLHRMIGFQMEPLECWEEMQRQHSAAVSDIKTSLESVTIEVPLIHRAKANHKQVFLGIKEATKIIRNAVQNTRTLHMEAQRFSPLLLELADVVIQERRLLEECFELLENFNDLKNKEETLQCQLIQMNKESRFLC